MVKIPTPNIHPPKNKLKHIVICLKSIIYFMSACERVVHTKLTRSHCQALTWPCRSMPTKKKANIPRSLAFTSGMALNCIQVTTDGRQRLNLSFKELDAVPPSIQKLSRVDELILSRNLIISLPDFIHDFNNVQVLDLHSNYVSTTWTLCAWLALLFTHCKKIILAQIQHKWVLACQINHKENGQLSVFDCSWSRSLRPLAS